MLTTEFIMTDMDFVKVLAKYNEQICLAWPEPDPDMTLPTHAKQVWLWKVDPTEECAVNLQLNRSHLLGLILARVHHTCSTCTDIKDLDSSLLIVDKAKCDFTLRDLRNCVQHLQACWIPRGLAAGATTLPVVDFLFGLFGFLSMSASTLTELMDDQGSVEQSYHTQDALLTMNAACLRRFLNIFLVMYRNLSIYATCVYLKPDTLPVECGIQKHHVYAGVDDFHMLSMNWDLMLAAKLVYIHDFSGMYNCVSQVVYFHNPDYQRRITCLEPVQNIAEGTTSTADATASAALYTLPSLLQLHPEITVIFDDCHGMQHGHWHWLMMGRTIFLVAPEGGVYHHNNITTLMGIYLQRHRGNV